MNRIERISAILIQLQSKKVVKGQEIADRFGISLRTAYRDIRALEISGVPILSEAGIGYSLVEGYRLPPVSFSQDEARAFLTAEKLVEKFTDPKTTSDYQSALFKIKAVLKTDDKTHIENLEDTIAILHHFDIPYPANSKDHLPIILNSIAQKKVLQIHYFSSHSREHTERLVEPVGIFMMGQHWHLIAFCLLRKDYRNFRVDRIHSIETTGNPFSKKHPSLKKYLHSMSEKTQALHSIQIRVMNSCLKYLGEQKYYHGFIAENTFTKYTEMDFLCASMEGFARWFITFGDVAEIVHPPELRNRIVQLATEISTNLTNS